jgi:hypothetical protein
MNEENLWLFIVDTDSYAGNFERCMCAYMTGQIGECEVGHEYADLFKEEVKDFDFGELVASVPDDNGCCRPTYIFPSKGSEKYNSLVIYFYNKPSTEVKKIMMERAIEFSQLGKSHPNKYIKDIKILGYRIIKKTISYKELEESVLTQPNTNELL